MNANIIVISNQKGGDGKTTTCANLGIGLVQEGKKVLLIDCDPQASLTISLGFPKPDQLPITLSDVMAATMLDQPINVKDAVLHQWEQADIRYLMNLPFAWTFELANVIEWSRVSVLRQKINARKTMSSGNGQS